MGKSVYRNGTVMSGDYAGKGVYIFSDAGVSILSNDENGKIIINSLFPTRFSILRKLSSHSVLRHKIVSQGIGVLFEFCHFYCGAVQHDVHQDPHRSCGYYELLRNDNHCS